MRWEFNQNSQGTEVTHSATGLRLDDVCNFGGCPWVKLDPAWMYQDSESTAQHGEFVMSEGMNAVHDGANLTPLSRAAEAALETLSDAERALSELIGTSSDKYTFLVRRARPQQHQSNGGAERAVRRLKESLAVLRAEMNQGGADVCFTERGLHDVVTYIALSHNHFSKAHGTDFSPLEYSTQRNLS